MEVMYKAIPFSPVTTLTESIGDGDTVIPVANVGAFPEAPNIAVIGGANEESETILYAAKTSNALSGCTRGVEGTAKSWNRGETISRNYTAKDHDSFVENIKELFNKTIKSAQINEAGNLVLTLQDNSTFDAGNAKGDKGDKGETGATGKQGPTGADGKAATIAIGTVTTGEPGTQAQVVNAGTANAAKFNFVIPRGDKGETGATGKQGPTGADGAPGAAATINGVNALTLAATGGLTGLQSGSTYTISGSGLKPFKVTITIPTSGWSNNQQTFTVNGIPSDPENHKVELATIGATNTQAAADTGLSILNEAANSLTLKVSKIPTTSFQVRALITPVQ